MRFHPDRLRMSAQGKKVSLDEVSSASGVAKAELEDLIARGRLFTVLPKISVKCRFCGVDLEDDEKTGFTCKKCLLKFSPKVNELEKKGINIQKYQEEAKNIMVDIPVHTGAEFKPKEKKKDKFSDLW